MKLFRILFFTLVMLILPCSAEDNNSFYARHLKNVNDEPSILRIDEHFSFNNYNHLIDVLNVFVYRIADYDRLRISVNPWFHPYGYQSKYVAVFLYWRW